MVIFLDELQKAVWYLLANSKNVILGFAADILNENLPLIGAIFEMRNKELDEYIKSLDV